MLELIEYDSEYDEDVKNLDEKIYEELIFHEDVIRNSITVALVDGEFAGVGYLMGSATFRQIDVKLDYYHINMQYRAVRSEAEVEVCEALILELMAQFEEIDKSYTDRRLILRHWVDEEAHAAQQFLNSFGFRSQRIMEVMVKELEDVECELPEGLRIDKLTMSEQDMDRYMAANGDGFTVHDSEGELRFKLEHTDAEVYAVFEGEDIVASVTTWEVTKERAATENVFCIKRCRQQGITTALLCYVLENLRKKGYTEACLTVYGDDYPAILLYQKLGYELKYNLIEMHYEMDYEPAMY
ncbi:MAG: GNAT family N-acetyltransferase [Lachnospiraceae bacterium]|nr:GNAT family N-acetyltransferase [Lachnospiraceae bacterium]